MPGIKASTQCSFISLSYCGGGERGRGRETTFKFNKMIVWLYQIIKKITLDYMKFLGLLTGFPWNKLFNFPELVEIWGMEKFFILFFNYMDILNPVTENYILPHVTNI